MYNLKRRAIQKRLTECGALEAAELFPGAVHVVLHRLLESGNPSVRARIKYLRTDFLQVVDRWQFADKRRHGPDHSFRLALFGLKNQVLEITDGYIIGSNVL